MKMLGVMTVAAIFLVMMTPLFAQAQSSQKTQLARLEEGQNALNKRMDDLRSDLKGDINDLRSELKGDIADLRNEIKGDITDLRDLIYVVLAGMVILVGFILWDRKSTIAPVVKQTRELEDNRDAVWKVLKEYAKREPRFAEVLRTAGIL